MAVRSILGSTGIVTDSDSNQPSQSEAEARYTLDDQDATNPLSLNQRYALDDQHLTNLLSLHQRYTKEARHEPSQTTSEVHIRC